MHGHALVFGVAEQICFTSFILQLFTCMHPWEPNDFQTLACRFLSAWWLKYAHLLIFSLFPWLNVGLKSALSSKKKFKSKQNPNHTNTIGLSQWNQLILSWTSRWKAGDNIAEGWDLALYQGYRPILSFLLSKGTSFLDPYCVASISLWQPRFAEVYLWMVSVLLAFAWFARVILSGEGILPHFILCSAQLLCFLAAGGFLIFSPHSSSFLKSCNF